MKKSNYGNRSLEKDKACGISAMDAAMRYLGPRARSVREMERHLDEKNYGEVEIMETVERLKELSMLGDETFARDFVDSRLRSKPVSRAHLREQLRAREVEEEAIRDALLAVTDDMERENAYLTARSFFPREGLGEDEKQFERLLGRLLRHGFGYSVSREALTHCQSEWEEESACNP